MVASTLPTNEDLNIVDKLPITNEKDKINRYIVQHDYVPRVLRNPSLAKRSRTLCYLLRWGAPAAGLKMSKDGYVMVGNLLRSGFLSDSSIADIRRIVEEDDKERFSIEYDATQGDYKVRANHGHGIPGVSVVERALTAAEVPGYVVHLTKAATFTQFL